MLSQKRRLDHFIAFIVTVVLSACAQQQSGSPTTADHVFMGGVIYTADAEQSVASALAVAEDRIVYVGDDTGAADYVGEGTRVHQLGGAMVLPGLHDMHVHSMAIVPRPGCDLDSAQYTLAELAEFVALCIEDEALPAGEWLDVTQWSFSNGNQPDDELTTLRQALDKAAPNHPIFLWGNDGHHGAVNSLALQQAVNSQGESVGISAQTLESDFAEFRETIGVDEHGEPNGEINETARYLIKPAGQDLFGPLPAEDMPKVGELLAASGITSILDAFMTPQDLSLYRPLAESGDLTYRLAAALYLNPSEYLGEQGELDASSMIVELEAVREAYEEVPYIDASFAKIFVDGVIEGNPFNDPPTLPNAAVLEPYKQPRLAFDTDTYSLEILGYVDPESDECALAEQALASQDEGAVAAFRAEHGFFPRQCRSSRGVLEHPEQAIHDYISALDAAGFNVHAHAIGDRAVRVALDAFEAAKEANGENANRHSLGHIQLVHPEDYARVGELGLSLAFTYAWITTDLAYDLTVMPFIDQVGSVDDLYSKDAYYFQNAYPAAGLKAAGATLVAGSDAPVDTRDPRPFVNIAQAVTRAGETGEVLNADHAIDLVTTLDAYTINGARLFGHMDKTGSLEVGKLADLAVIDQDLFQLIEEGRAHEISQTEVLMTLFEGRVIFERDSTAF